MNIQRRPPETTPERVTVSLSVDEIEKAIRLYVGMAGEELPEGVTRIWGLDPERPGLDSAVTLCIDLTAREAADA